MPDSGLQLDPTSPSVTPRLMTSVRLSHLTHAARTIPPHAISPYANDRAYRAAFDHVHQTLTAQRFSNGNGSRNFGDWETRTCAAIQSGLGGGGHLLVCRDRGISETTAFVEFARECVRGHRRGLEHTEFIHIDARHLTRRVPRTVRLCGGSCGGGFGSSGIIGLRVTVTIGPPFDSVDAVRDRTTRG